MTLLRRPEPQTDGRYHWITPENAQWHYVHFAAWDLQPDQVLNLPASANETCLVLLSGIATIQAGQQWFAEIGERMSVFEDKAPHAVYVAPHEVMMITAHTPVELAVCAAPSQSNHPTRWLKPDTMSREQRGQSTNTRYVCNILPQDQPADSLLVVEVRTPSGHWSSYPPHKHDQDNIPHETFLEETYYHRLNPHQGFCFQRVFTDDLSIDETMSVTDKCVVLVPRGYHPVGVPHGYESYYLNVMAGPTRRWIFKNHPDHEWILK